MTDQMNGALSPWLREQRFRAAAPYIRGRVLDFGCGIGLLGQRFTCSSYAGTDISTEALTEAGQRHPHGRFFLPEELSTLPAGGFDTIAMLAVIEHLPAPTATLRDMARLLAPDGQIVLTTPEPWLDWAHGLGGRFGLFAKESHDEHQSLMNRAGIVCAASAAGLQLVEYRRFLLGANQLAVLRHEGQRPA